MKRTHFFNIMLIIGVLQLCMFSVGCGGTDKREETYGDGKIMLRYYVKEIDGNFLKHGMYKAWYHDGTKQEEIEFENGKMDGKYISWHENGTKKVECEFKNGKKHGLYASWYQNGAKEGEIEYKNDEMNGNYNWWYENGTQGCQEQYVKGLRDGTSKNWYSDGRKKSIANYNKGTIDGKVVILDNKNECTATFKDGLLHGKIEAYYSEDACDFELKIKASFNNGVPVDNFFISQKNNCNGTSFSMEGRFNQGSVQIDNMQNIEIDGDRLLAGGLWYNDFNEFFYSWKGVGALWDNYHFGVGFFTELLPKLKNCIAETEKQKM